MLEAACTSGPHLLHLERCALLSAREGVHCRKRTHGTLEFRCTLLSTQPTLPEVAVDLNGLTNNRSGLGDGGQHTQLGEARLLL